MNKIFEGNFQALNGKEISTLIKELDGLYKSEKCLQGIYVSDVDTIKQVTGEDGKRRKVDNSMYRVEKTTTFQTTFDKSYGEYPTVRAYNMGRADSGYEKKETTTDYTYVNGCVKALTDAINGVGIADPSLAMKVQINIDLNNPKDFIKSEYKLYTTENDGTVSVANVTKQDLIDREIIRDKAPDKVLDATKVMTMTLSLKKVKGLYEV